MEESVNTGGSLGLGRRFLKNARAEEMSSLGLAYIGDAVFEILVRSYALKDGPIKAEKLHKRVTDVVNAGSQSRISYLIKDFLSEEELEVFKRARNHRTRTSAKNQSVTDYRRATGLEALFGWLYLKGETARVEELFLLGIEGLEKE